MYPTWKLLRILWAMVTRTPYVNVRASGLSDDNELRYRSRRNHVGCRLLCDILGVHVRTEGPRPDRGGLLVVSNHFGVLDPLVLSSVFPMVPVGKAELLRWPLIGWVCRTHGMIPVEREVRTTVSHFAEQVRRRLAAGVNVVVFPEGTTSADPTIRPFKTGAFEAVSGLEEAAVLPAYLSVNSLEGRPVDQAARRRVVWADGNQSFVEHAREVARIRSVTFTVRLGLPIPTVNRDRKELAQLAFHAVEDLQRRGDIIPHETGPR